jgi:hypothetical protein
MTKAAAPGFRPLISCLPFLLALLCCNVARAATADAEESPWLAVPVISSDPKIGTSLGALAGYLYRFDPGSPVSIFGIAGNYSNTDSYTAGLFTKSYFGGDRHRLIAGIASGKIHNDYSDFLGSGLPAQTTDDLRFGAARYLYRIYGDWFIGGQFVATNYTISAENWLTDELLDILGLTGFDSNGAGAVVLYDSRDNQDSPSRGRFFEMSNIAYRKALGGDESFDAYSAKFRQYLPHGDGNVVALRVQGRWTSDDTPTAGYSSLGLRGYVRGNYIAPNVTTFEAEERYRLGERWALAGFAGAACLYDGLGDCNSGANWYPAGGGGIIYTLKPRDKLVARMDYAVGKQGNSGFYISFGHPF